MAEAPELTRPHGSRSYYKDRKDEQRSQPYIAEEGRTASSRLKIESKAGPEFEAYLVALLRTLGATFETENLAKQADVLIKELEVQPAQFVYMALANFIEKYEDEKLTRVYNEADERHVGELGELYEFNNGAVEGFLAEHPSLADLLFQTHERIGEYFGSGVEAALEVVADPEALGDRQLFVLIRAGLPRREARARLAELDRGWWMDALPAAEGRMEITLS